MDFVRDVMLLATVHADDDETVVGSAQYVSLEAKCAEVAFTVEEDFRGRGIAGRLLRHLIAIDDGSGTDCTSIGSVSYDDVIAAQSPARDFPERSTATAHHKPSTTAMT